MKTILVLSSHPEFAEAVRSSLVAEQYRVIHRATIEEAEPLLVHGLSQVCILDADLMGVETVWQIEKIRRHSQRIPIVAFTSNNRPEWQEEALLRGVSQILNKPVSPRLLVSLLERLLSSAAAPSFTHVAPSAGQSSSTRPATETATTGRFVNASQTLDLLRDFSGILTHSLDADAMLKQVLQFIRELMSVNRAAIFLEHPRNAAGESTADKDHHRLRAIAAIGLNVRLLEHLELSLESGIGFQVAHLGRIVRRDSEESRSDLAAQKEFELLGAQVAVPITNRDTTIGVAVFDGRLTGEPLVNVELELIFHLLEQVGLALRNISLHDQLAASHETMTSVLRELSSACVVVARDLRVLHANRAVRQLLGRKTETNAQLDFADLPPMLGTKIFQVLNNGAALQIPRYESESQPGRIYKVTIIPLRHGNATVPVSALLTAEDLTESEQLTKLESEAAKLRLIHSMSNRLVNEIGNAIQPISTYHQLLPESYADPEFRRSFNKEVGRNINRILRLQNQMRFLARDGHLEQNRFSLKKTIEEAFKDATRQLEISNAEFTLEKLAQPVEVAGNQAALKHAFSEIFINALQACPKDPKIRISLQFASDGEDQYLTIEVRDNGDGFTTEAAKKIPAPFYTTRVVGLGLGLAVSQKIIETHNGRLEIVPSESGIIRVVLPVEAK